jgi:hypothetical protein
MKVNGCRVLLALLLLLGVACAGDVAPNNLVTIDDGDVGGIRDAQYPPDPTPDTGQPPAPDVVEEPDTSGPPPIPDADPTPQSCTDPSQCTAPEVCIIDTISGDGECGRPVDNREAGRTCTQSNQCLSGICLDGICVDACTTSADCGDGLVCRTANLGGIELDVCLEPDPCTSDAGCSEPFICAVDRRDDIRVACLDPNVGGGDLGEACANDGQCLAGLCLGGTCTQPCDSPADCAADGSYLCSAREIESGTGQFDTINVCTARPPEACLSDAQCSAPDRCVAAVTTSGLMFTCGAPNAGGGESGASCTSDADCAQNLCLSGVCAGPCAGNGDCDTANDYACKTTPVSREGQNASLSVCKPPTPCEASSQCGIGETCYVRRTGTTIETYCRAPNAGGANQGSACASDTACRSNYCHDGRFRDHCAVPCQTNADCTTGGSLSYVCRETNIPLAGGGTDSTKVCVLADPTPCTSQDQCIAGATQCAVVTNTANTGLETVCIPNQAGTLANGQACTTNSQCRGQLCYQGLCSSPCVREDQCGGAQLCGPNTVSKDGHTANLNVCETLTTCTSSADCAAPRECNTLYLVSGEIVPFCGFPNATGGALGTSCTTDSQCRENLCLFFSSNECSLACTQHSDCGNGQICTSYAGVGLCMSSCTHNGSCSAGNICTYHINDRTNQVDYLCHQPYGTGTIGQPCNTWEDCATGVCLEMSLQTYIERSCTTDADCTADFPSCQCPLDNPNCTTGKRCATVTSETQCSQICDPAQGNTHCPADSLSRCTNDVRLSWNGGSDTVSACSRPMAQ